MEIDTITMYQIIDLLKRMYDMSESKDWWTNLEIESLINDGADLYADNFRNNN